MRIAAGEQIVPQFLCKKKKKIFLCMQHHLLKIAVIGLQGIRQSCVWVCPVISDPAVYGPSHSFECRVSVWAYYRGSHLFKASLITPCCMFTVHQSIEITHRITLTPTYTNKIPMPSVHPKSSSQFSNDLHGGWISIKNRLPGALDKQQKIAECRKMNSTKHESFIPSITSLL